MGGPLTFGDLQGRGINLEVMTTNLTHGWPVRLPFSSRELFFHPGDRDVKQRPYRRTQAWKAQALKATADLMALVRTWRTPDPKLRMDYDPPKPEPELRINPRR